MKRMKQLAALALGCILSVTAVEPAAAAGTVDAVYLGLVTEEDLLHLMPGDSLDYTTPVEDGGSYYIDDTEITQNSSSGALLYTMEIYAADGASFSNNTLVSVYGAYDISVTIRSTNHMRVTARAYPFQVLSEVSGLAIDGDGKKATWNKVDNAKSYSVIISYADNHGNTHRVKKTTKVESIDISSYINKYDFVDVAVRPEKGTGTKDRYIAVPNYASISGSIDDESYVDYYTFNLPTATNSTSGSSVGSNPFASGSSSSGSYSGSSSSSTSGSYTGSGPMSGSGYSSTGSQSSGSGPMGSGSGSSSSTSGSPLVTGWMGSGNTWYYLVNGTRTTGWYSVTPEEWYFFDNSGLMCAGWFNDGTEAYLLNPNHDGTYGKMMTGYQTYNGLLYYFNQSHDGTFGAVYKNRATPDGRWADANGVVR